MIAFPCRPYQLIRHRHLLECGFFFFFFLFLFWFFFFCCFFSFFCLFCFFWLGGFFFCCGFLILGFGFFSPPFFRPHQLTSVGLRTLAASQSFFFLPCITRPIPRRQVPFAQILTWISSRLSHPKRNRGHQQRQRLIFSRLTIRADKAAPREPPLTCFFGPGSAETVCLDFSSFFRCEVKNTFLRRCNARDRPFVSP